MQSKTLFLIVGIRSEKKHYHYRHPVDKTSFSSVNGHMGYPSVAVLNLPLYLMILLLVKNGKTINMSQKSSLTSLAGYCHH